MDQHFKILFSNPRCVGAALTAKAASDVATSAEPNDSMASKVEEKIDRPSARYIPIGTDIRVEDPKTAGAAPPIVM